MSAGLILRQRILPHAFHLAPNRVHIIAGNTTTASSVTSITSSATSTTSTRSRHPLGTTCRPFSGNLTNTAAANATAATMASATDATPRFIDIGANLTDGMFQGSYHGKQYHEPDLAQVLQRGWDAGVERVMITAGMLPEAKEALELAEKMDVGAKGGEPGEGEERRRLFTTVGVHPTRCGEFEASGDPEGYLTELKEIASAGSYIKNNHVEVEANTTFNNANKTPGGSGSGSGRVVAVGECGLDYDRLQFCPRETQMEWFERQFEIAETTGLPMFLHMRAAAEDFTEILTRNRHRFTAGVVHSFTGTADEAEALLAVDGIYIGINGCSLRAPESLEVVKALPVDRIMLETDAPWCGIKNSHAGSGHVKTTWPAKDKKKRAGIDTGECVKDRSEPCHIRQVLEVLAAVKGMDENELAETCYQNTLKVFFPDETAQVR